jgi:CHASE2 domain-containing sensor protein
MRKRPLWWWTFIAWLAATFAMGFLGAVISQYLDTPSYFGGTIGFCLTGMAGLFAIAAKMAKKP